MVNIGKKCRRRPAESELGPSEFACKSDAGLWGAKDMSGKGYEIWGFSKIPPKVRINTWLAIILLVPFYSVFQGIDLTDAGRALVDSHNFIAEDAYKTAGSWFYLSNAISGLWMTVFGGLGFIAIKLGGVAISWSTAAFAYYGLRCSFRREAILAALAITACFVNARSLVQWMNYDTISGLFYTAGVAFLIRGVKENRLFLFGTSGFTFLLLRYVRFSSLLGMGFIMAVPLYYWLADKDWKNMYQSIIAYSVGLVAGLIFIAGVGLATGAPLVLPRHTAGEVVREQTAEKKERIRVERRSAGYGIRAMAVRLFRQYWEGMKKGAPILLVIAALAVLIVKIPRLGLPIIIATGIISCHWLFPGDPRCHFVNSILVAFLCISLLVLGKRAPAQSMLMFLALCVLVCTPAGSNTGLAKASHGMWFAIPLLLLCPHRWHNVRIFKLCLPGKPFAAAALLLGAMILGGSIFLGWRNSYRDHPDRSKMNATVDHPRLRGLWTTPERARVLQQLLDNYEAYIAPDEPLLTYGSAPGLHFIMDRVSYLTNPWTEQLYVPKTGKLRLPGEEAWRDAIDKYEGAPVLVIARGSCRNALWPVQTHPLKAQPTIRLAANKRAYKLAWAGEFFLIYRPKDGKVAKVQRDNPHF